MRFEKWQALGNDYLIVEREQLPFELTPARVRRLCQQHFGLGADGVLVLSRPRTPLRSAPADPQPRRIDRRALGQRRPGGGPLSSPPRLDRAGCLLDRDSGRGDPPRITGPDSCTVDMGHARLRSSDFPSGPPDGRGSSRSTGPEPRMLGLSAREHRQPPVRDRGRRHGRPDGARPAAIGPAIEAHELFPNRTNVSWYAELPVRRRDAGAGFARGSSSAGWGRRSPREPGPRARRSPTCSAALDGRGGHGRARRRRARGRGGEGLHVELSGWAIPVFEGELSATSWPSCRSLMNSPPAARAASEETHESQ